jgi:ribosomal protein L32
MAVPKKRTSKSKKNLRKTVWKQKAFKQAIEAYFIANKASKKIQEVSAIVSPTPTVTKEDDSSSLNSES